jgi:hypothetical protein
MRLGASANVGLENLFEPSASGIRIQLCRPVFKWSSIVKLYRGCMFYVLGFAIAIFSVALGRVYGIVGMLVPWIVVGFAYLFVDSVIAELLNISEELSRRDW